MLLKELLTRKCPKCGSTRIAPDYQRSPLILRLFLLQNLMCDRCNLPFKAFALPRTRARRHHRVPKEG